MLAEEICEFGPMKTLSPIRMGMYIIWPLCKRIGGRIMLFIDITVDLKLSATA